MGHSGERNRNSGGVRTRFPEMFSQVFGSESDGIKQMSCVPTKRLEFPASFLFYIDAESALRGVPVQAPRGASLVPYGLGAWPGFPVSTPGRRRPDNILIA